MLSDTNTDDTSNDTLKEKRMAVLDEVEKILEEAEAEIDQPLNSIKTNINIAEDNLLDDGEYDYAVRFALERLTQAVMRAEDGQEATVERIEKYRDQLTTKAELAPPEQLKR